ncbi:TetR/AcrR family transcriptional regulator [Pseudorhodobacter ferrugineus]|nr:TetR/AcrR family transcriptional regulator [Pseudorhodobacter ferrugineus]
MHSPTLKSDKTDPTEAIFAAALRAFAQYGYRRTAMEDIANGADMSRAALYLRFRNKEDIFRSLARAYFSQAQAGMQAALGAAKDTETALLAAFAAKDGKLMELILTSPHGGELLDAGFSVSADIVAEGEAAMAATFAHWYTAQGLPPDLGNGEDMAETTMAALKGLKTTAADFPSYQAGQARLARLIVRALSPAQP